MNCFKLSAVLFSIAALGTSALAQSAAGTWNGRIQMGKIPVPANATPQQKQQAEMGMSMIKKMTFALTLKKGGAYTIKMGGFGGGKGQEETGTWTQSGKTITMKSSKKRGKTDSQSATISADGKTLTVVPPQGQGAPAGMKLIFKKG